MENEREGEEQSKEQEKEKDKPTRARRACIPCRMRKVGELALTDRG